MVQEGATSDPGLVLMATGFTRARLVTMPQVVCSVAFLLSDEASYTTGTNLIVAGGLA